MKFEPKDFGYIDGNHDFDKIECIDAASIANAKLEEWQQQFNEAIDVIKNLPYLNIDPAYKKAREFLEKIK